MSNVQLLTGLGSFELSSVEVVNGFLGAFWSVFFVDTLRIVIADESDLADGVLHQVKRLDFTEGFEHFFDLILWIFHRNVLDVDIVDELSECSSILWLKFHGNSVVILGTSLDGFGGSGLIVEADESISSG